MLKEMHAVYLFRDDGSMCAEPIAMFEFCDQVSNWVKTTYGNRQYEVVVVKAQIKMACPNCKGSGYL